MNQPTGTRTTGSPWTIPPAPSSSAGTFTIIDFTIRRPADRAALAAAVTTSLAADIAVRAGVVGVGGAIAFAAAAAALLLTRRIDTANRQAQALAFAGGAFGLLL